MKIKILLTLMVGLVWTATSFGNTIDIATGIANWQVDVPGSGFVPATVLTSAETNGSWAPAPTGSAWLSYGAQQGTSCVVGQTPGNGCASSLINPSGDLWLYSLNISAASLAGDTSGTLNFIFGADDSVNLFIGNGGSAQQWSGSSALGCSNSAGATSAGSTQATYATCTSTVSYGASALNADGSLTLEADVTNGPIRGCPACGNPTGFVLGGEIVTTSTSVPTPEPSTMPLLAVGLLALAGFSAKRIL